MKRTIKVLFAVMALSLSQVSVEAACKRTAAEEVGGPAGKRTAAEEVVSIVFHNIPVNQQSKERGKLNRCGYHALFNAARFARVFASPENLELSTLEARITHFGQTVFGLLFDSEPIKTLNDAIEGEDGWGLRIRPAGAYLGGISEEEIATIIDGGGAGAGSLKSRCDEGILSIWGSMTDFENSMGEWFSYDRMGRSMRALQEGRPVGFCVCLNEEVVTASGGSGGGGGVWHWVSFGVQRVDGDVHVFTMDSLSQVTTHELVVVDGNVFDFGDDCFLTTPVTHANIHFTPALNGRIAAVVQQMMTRNPVDLAVKSLLVSHCEGLIRDIQDSPCLADSEKFSEIVGNRLNEPIFEVVRNFPSPTSSGAMVFEIVQEVFAQSDLQLGHKPYLDKIMETIAIFYGA